MSAADKQKRIAFARKMLRECTKISGQTRSSFPWMARHLFINIIHMTRQEHLNQRFGGKSKKGVVKAVQ